MPNRQRLAPQTFAAQPQNMVQETGTTAYGQGSFGITGGRILGTGRMVGREMIAPDGPSTLDTLLELGQGLLAPKIEEARKRAAMRGTVSALQGISAAELQDSELLQGIFGDSTAVAAAREVERTRAVGELQSSMLENMGELRQMSAQEFQTWLPTQLERVMTGDPNTDALVGMDFVERMPNMVDTHTKAHMKFQQEAAYSDWMGTAHREFKLIQQTEQAFYAGEASQDMVTKQQERAVQALMAYDGVSGEAYQKGIEDLYQRLSMDGNVQAIEMIEDTGALDALEGSTRRSLLAYREEAYNKAREENPAYQGLAATRANFEHAVGTGLTGMNVSQVNNWVNKWNQNHPQGTPGYIDMDERAKVIQRYHKGNEMRVRQQEEKREPNTMALFMAGQGNMARFYGATSDSVNTSAEVHAQRTLAPAFQAFQAAASGEISPEERDAIVQESFGKLVALEGAPGNTNVRSITVPQYLERAKQALREGVVDPEADFVVSQILAQEGGQFVASKYLSDKEIGELSQAMDWGALSDPVTAARWSRRKPVPQERTVDLQEGLEEAATRQGVGGWFSRAMRSIGFVEADMGMSNKALRENYVPHIIAEAKAVLPFVASMNSGLTSERLFEQSVQHAINRSDMISGFPVDRMERETTLYEGVMQELVKQGHTLPSISAGSPDFQRATRDVLQQKLRPLLGETAEDFDTLREMYSSGTRIGVAGETRMDFYDASGEAHVVIRDSEIADALWERLTDPEAIIQRERREHAQESLDFWFGDAANIPGEDAVQKSIEAREGRSKRRQDPDAWMDQFIME